MGPQLSADADVLRRGHYRRIATAEILRCADGTRVTTPELYVAWLAGHLLEAGDLARPWPCDLEATASVEWGRWVVPCLNCTVIHPLTHPVWQIACCGECGIVLRRVVFPADVAGIERALLARPVRSTQNWVPTQTVDDLVAENLAHGVLAA
jgi:hypothetical protein